MRSIRMPGRFSDIQVRNRERAFPVSAHPEDWRLAGARPRDVTFYTRPDCHLCEEARAAIAPVLAEFGAVLHEVNIEEDLVLKERYGWDIPVIFIGARKVAKHRVNAALFRRQLREAG
jgi:glutaredoxin